MDSVLVFVGIWQFCPKRQSDWLHSCCSFCWVCARCLFRPWVALFLSALYTGVHGSAGDKSRAYTHNLSFGFMAFSFLQSWLPQATLTCSFNKKRGRISSRISPILWPSWLFQKLGKSWKDGGLICSWLLPLSFNSPENLPNLCRLQSAQKGFCCLFVFNLAQRS